MYRQFIPVGKRRQYLKDPMFQVIMESILDVFEYGKDSKEYKRVQNLINGFAMTTGEDAAPETVAVPEKKGKKKEEQALI